MLWMEWQSFLMGQGADIPDIIRLQHKSLPENSGSSPTASRGAGIIRNRKKEWHAVMSSCLHLGKGAMDNGYGMFRNMLEYKLEEQGKTFVKVDRFFPSSKKCSICGKIKTEMPLSEREYICECGNQMDRDVNAAVNLRKEAKRLLCA